MTGDRDMKKKHQIKGRFYPLKVISKIESWKESRDFVAAVVLMGKSKGLQSAMQVRGELRPSLSSSAYGERFLEGFSL